MEDKLNEIIPYESIIRVLLKKVKIQEEIIADLEDELRYYEKPHRFLAVLQDMSDDEISELRKNPYYRKVKAMYANKEKEIDSLHREIEHLRNIIKTYDMIY